MINELNFNKTQRYASFLIKDGMRIGLAHSITGVSKEILRELRHTAHGQDAPSLCKMPSNTIAYIKSGQSPLALATVVSVYLHTEKEHKSPAESFVVAWEAAKLFSDEGTQLDINAAWYAVRDVKAGLVTWCHCKNCKAGYIFDTKITKKNDACPYCGTRDQRLLGVFQ